MTTGTPSRWSAADGAAIRQGLAAGRTTWAIAQALGRAESSVTRRIETLTRARTTTRACMCCRNPFTSDGPHNRLCGRCRSKEKTPFDF
jgi:uncharacterized paraquat-inducible protein A